MKKYLALLIIIITAACLRFLYLDIIPSAVSGDELHYITTAKSILLTGTDLTGTWNPWSILWFRFPPNEHQAELPYLLHIMSGAQFPFSLFLIKLPFALLSVGIVILLYAVTLELFGARAALAAGAIAAVNPWLIVMGRTGYEAAPAMFFYLLSLWTLLKTKKWQILWTIIPLLFAFYSYIGTKVLFVPFVAGICLLSYTKYNKKNALPYLVLTLLSIAAAVSFFVLTKTDPSGSRLGDIFLPSSSLVASAVNSIRSTTIATPLLPILVNKYILYAQTILDKIFRIFSPSYLFAEGDQFFLPVRHGFFYYPDAVFLLLGSIFLARKHRHIAWIMLMLVGVSTLPQLVSTTLGDFSIHLTLLFPILIIVIGAGIAEFIRKPWPILAVILVYIFSIAGFTNAYFHRVPLTGYADFPKRILTRYLQFATARSIPVAVYARSNSDTFQKYMLYADVITKKQMLQLREVLSSEIIEWDTIQFLPCQSEKLTPSESTVIIDTECGRPTSEHHQSITRLTDGGEHYIIEEDKVCSGYSLKRYADHITLADFDIQKLTEQQFCETYISQR